MTDAIGLLLVSGGSLWMDLKEGRTANRWLLICLLAGMGNRLYSQGFSGLMRGTGGLLLAFLLTGWLHIFHMLGAGDIKLLCVIGFFLGAERLLSCLFYALVVGAGISLCILLHRRLLLERMAYFLNYVEETMQKGRITPYLIPGFDRPENIHFTIPVFISVILSVLRWY